MVGEANVGDAVGGRVRELAARGRRWDGRHPAIGWRDLRACVIVRVRVRVRVLGKRESGRERKG